MPSFGRIQKLLCDEYCQFEDTVLIESPFAETTRDGRGLEQVHLGITPTKLIIAYDYLDTPCDPTELWCGDPDEVETLELMSLYPVEYVSLSVHSTKRRQALKATFANHVTRYFELGGLDKRRMFWNLWCERVLHLNPSSAGVSNGPSQRPSRHGSSISRSTLITWESSHSIDSGDRNGDDNFTRRKWTDKNIYLGTLREREDADRPTAVVGMGATSEMKMLYLKPPKWRSTDDCEAKMYWKLQDVYDYEMYTYTGGPTSNVTYTSIAKGYSAKSNNSTKLLGVK